MKSTKYLYDIEVNTLENMPYKEALKYKVKAAREVMIMMVFATKDISGMSPEYEDFKKRYLAADKAKKFNEELLNELRN